MGITSYAQNFEDVLLWRALGHIERGTYIDVGAQHPVVDSVSKAFYDRGWRGIDVEPFPVYADMLRKDRPEDRIVQSAIARKSGLLKFYEVPGTGLSTADPKIAEEHRSSGYEVMESLVTCITFDELLASAGSSDVHWAKIDVEGFETEVLRGWKSSRVRPWVMVVESTYPVSQRETHNRFEHFILSKGYTAVFFDGLNRYYVSDERPELKKAFGSGANVFDAFQLAETSWAVGNITAQLRDLQVTHSELRATFDEQRGAADRLARQLTEHAQREAQRLTAHIAQREQSHAQQVSQVRIELNAALAKRTGEHLEERQALVQRLEKLTNSLSHSAQARVDAVAAQLRHAESECDSLRRQLGVTASELHTLRLQHERLGHDARLERTQLEADLRVAEAEHQRVMAALQELRGDYEKLQRESDVAQEQLRGALAGGTAALQSLQRDHEELKLESRTTREQLQHELTGRLGALQALRSDHEGLKLESQAARGRFQRELASGIAALQALQRDHEKLKLESQTTRESLQRELASEVDALQALQREHQKLKLESQTTREGLRRELANEIDAREDLGKLLDAARKQSGETQAELESRRAETAEMLAGARMELGAHKGALRELTDLAGAEVALIRSELHALQNNWLLRCLSVFLPTSQKARTATSALDRLWNAFAKLEAFTSTPGPNDSSPSSSADPLPMSLNQILSLPDVQFIDAAYRLIVKRAADAAGRRHYLRLLEQGAGRPAVICDLADSAEGQALAAYEELTALSDEEFVSAVYLRVLGRRADDDGKRHYLRVLRKHGRARVVNDMERSSEARRRNPAAAELRDEIEAYAKERRRSRGVSGWLNQSVRIERRLNRLDEGLEQLAHQIAALTRQLEEARRDGERSGRTVVLAHSLEVSGAAPAPTAAANRRIQVRPSLHDAIRAPDCSSPSAFFATMAAQVGKTAEAATLSNTREFEQ